MNQLEIEQILIKTVSAIQEQSGRDFSPIDASTCPLDDLEDFDSLNGVEATVDVFGELQLELELNNIFCEGDQSLSIAQAAKRIVDMASQLGSK